MVLGMNRNFTHLSLKVPKTRSKFQSRAQKFHPPLNSGHKGRVTRQTQGWWGRRWVVCVRPRRGRTLIAPPYFRKGIRQSTMAGRLCLSNNLHVFEETCRLVVFICVRPHSGESAARRRKVTDAIWVMFGSDEDLWHPRRVSGTTLLAFGKRDSNMNSHAHERRR